MSELLSNFPFPTIRPLQQMAIEKIHKAFTKDDKHFVLLEAPTGIGKSAIAITLARTYNSAYIITPQKILQDQYVKDFSEDENKPLVELKGRNSYLCTNINDQQTTCDISPCRHAGKTSHEQCVDQCNYHQQVQKTIDSHIALFNFKSFLYQYNHTERFPERDLLIVDEGHNTEAELMSFVELNLSDEHLQQYNINFPQLARTEEYIEYFEDIDLKGILNKLYKFFRESGDIRTSDRWKRMGMKLGFIMREAKKEVFISEFKLNKNKKGKKCMVISLKPLYVRKYAMNKLFSSAKNVLIMSATLLSKGIMTNYLGINNKEAEYIKLPSMFPKENRKIHKDFAGFMTFKEKNKTLPKLIGKIEKLLEQYEDKKGIIHTHSFSNLKAIKEGINHKFLDRLLFQPDFPSREHMIEYHKNNLDGSVIVAPAMHEGLDLKDDLSRFQIICKVPYPSFMENAQLRIRIKEDWNYYQWLTALKLVQSYGRSIRNEADWAETYILDEQFDKFQSHAGKFLPDWFKEAIVK